MASAVQPTKLKRSKSIQYSQQGLYRTITDESVSGVINLKLKNPTNAADQQALVHLLRSIYCEKTYGLRWVVGFSYDFAPIAIQHLPVTDSPSELGLDDSFNYGDEKYFTNSKYDAIVLPNAPNVECFLEEREVFRQHLKRHLNNKVDVYEAFCTTRADLKILGARFLDGVNNAQDPISMERHVLMTEDDSFQGSTFLFTQNFDFDQSAISKLTDEELENIIGRNVEHQQIIGSMDKTNSHIERMRVINATSGLNLQMLRFPMTSLTDADSLENPSTMIKKKEAEELLQKCDPVHVGKGCPFMNTGNDFIEKGLYFAGFCKAPNYIATLLHTLSGNEQLCERMNISNEFDGPDRLLSFMEGKSGGYFWIPSGRLLRDNSNQLDKQASDIKLLDIWDVERKNEYMFLNTQQWIHSMSTKQYVEPEHIPTNRILHLSSATFDRWRSRWYKRTPNVVLPHLEEILFKHKDYIPEDFVDTSGNKLALVGDKRGPYKFNDRNFASPPLGTYIKDIPIIMRKGLAIREQLRLLTNDKEDYANADQLDTYRIDPGEIIVGTLEEYSLASGKLAMEYLCYDQERQDAKQATLSELSAMGHIVPDYGIMLTNGIPGILKEIQEKIDSAENPYENPKVHFWKGAKYAVEGIRIYIQNYLTLASTIREQLQNNEYKGPNLLSGLNYQQLQEPTPCCFVNLEDSSVPKRETLDTISSEDCIPDDLYYSWTSVSSPFDILNLEGIEKRLKKILEGVPETLLEAVQLFFMTHASLHLTADPVSAGRLDQIFFPYYEKDLKRIKEYILTKTKGFKNKKLQQKILEKAAKQYDRGAQEIIDALCLKWDEKANFNMTMVPDVTAFGTTAVLFGTGPFASGDSNNQWFHQVTLGGMLPNDNKIGQDGCNNLSMFFLRSLRRLPLTAPCISLRVNEQTSKEILEEAAKAILSGGAHPIIFHDKNISSGIENSLKQAYANASSPHYSSEKLLAYSRDYSCDGCYEPLMMGYTDFSFLYVNLLSSLECALNRGATYKDAGPEYLRGKNIDWNSPPVEKIQSLEHLLSVTIDFHLAQMLEGFFRTPLNAFGALANFCPSPLLSTFMHHAIERGRDLTSGGTTIHTVTPMLIGLSNFIDSLFAIDLMVYDTRTKVTTLPEISRALISNWGKRDESWKPLDSVVRNIERAERYDYLRQLSLSLPKFGGNDQAQSTFISWMSKSRRSELRERLNNFGHSIVKRVVDKAKEIGEKMYDPNSESMKKLIEKFSDDKFPFRFTVCVGGGTFENYVGAALDYGASADGRLAGQPIASDCSPAPTPIDLPPLSLSKPSNFHDIRQALKAYDCEEFRTGYANAAEVDINILETTKLESIHAFLQGYATDRIPGSNLLTFTTGDPVRYAEAIVQPQQFDLFRVRMGGWTNFYTSQWLTHQKQHQRRPFYKIDITSDESKGRKRKSSIDSSYMEVDSPSKKTRKRK